jgi:hypothetical protein
LWALHCVDETELRLYDTGVSGGAAKFSADRAMQLDQILNGEIANAAVNR